MRTGLLCWSFEFGASLDVGCWTLEVQGWRAASAVTRSTSWSSVETQAWPDFLCTAWALRNHSRGFAIVAQAPVGDANGAQSVNGGFLLHHVVAAGLRTGERRFEFGNGPLELSLADQQPAPVHKEVGGAQSSAARGGLLVLVPGKLPELITVGDGVGAVGRRGAPL